MITIGPTLSGIDRCPQCGVAKPLLSYVNDTLSLRDSSEILMAWFVYKCSYCKNIVSVKAFINRNDYSHDSTEFLNKLRVNEVRAVDIIPDIKVLDNDLPENPRRYLEQALQSTHMPDGAVMLAGSAIDAMLKLKGYTDGTVYARIEKAVADHLLTQDMSDWAHAVRLESNKPRHADLDEPHATEERAKLTIQFAQALGDFLFVFPAKVARGKAASEKELKADEAKSGNVD